MPEINSIPYENAEDLNKYLYDNFYSTENIDTFATQTAAITSKIFELELNTGVTADSVAMTNYNHVYWNPYYGEAVFKCYMNNMDDVFAFFGFKKTLAEPTYDMIESHAGFMIYNGKLYASVGNDYDQQRVEIVGIDVTKVENFKIAYNKFSIQPLPYIEEELGLPAVYTIDRKWKLMTILANYPPENVVHNMIQYIKNSVGSTKYIRFNRFIYKEVYAD